MTPRESKPADPEEQRRAVLKKLVRHPYITAQGLSERVWSGPVGPASGEGEADDPQAGKKG